MLRALLAFGAYGGGKIPLCDFERLSASEDHGRREHFGASRTRQGREIRIQLERICSDLWR